MLVEVFTICPLSLTWLVVREMKNSHSHLRRSATVLRLFSKNSHDSAMFLRLRVIKSGRKNAVRSLLAASKFGLSDYGGKNFISAWKEIDMY